MVIRKDLGGAMAGAMEIAALDEELGVEYGPMKIIYTTTRSGRMKQMRMLFTVATESLIPVDDAGNGVPMVMEYDYDMLMTIKETGDDVVISWPDFSQFPELPDGSTLVDPTGDITSF